MPDALPPLPSLLADPFVLQVARTKVRLIESICTVPPVERSLTSYQGSSPEPKRLGHRPQLEKLSGLCNLCLPSGELSPESGWLTGPWGEVSSDAERACWGSLWGLSNILKGSLFLSLGPFRNVCQLFHSFKPQFFFNDCGLWILLCLRHKLESLWNSFPNIILLVWIHRFFVFFSCLFPIRSLLLTCPLCFSHKGLHSRLEVLHPSDAISDTFF